jgi:iron complex transport system ATP-binding protein
VERAAPLVEEASLTILCSFPIGPGNLENLRLAARARRLVIAAPSEETPRGFFSDEGRRLFEKLAAGAPQLSYRELVRAVESGGQLSL